MLLPLTIGPGYVFAQRYRIERLLGSGGMGAVYEAVHLTTARRRALKIMHPRPSGDGTVKERFAQEARLGARIDSPYVVDVLDAGVDEATGLPYLAMELLRGESLGRRLRRNGPLAPAEAVTYLHQAALALDQCHAAGVVHRDVKPENLFLQRRGDGQSQIKLLDLGVAKLILPAHDTTTEAVGTPAYMAPEQLAAGKGIGPATDVYALGMVAYTSLVGRYYWEPEKKAASVFALADAIRSGSREPATARARAAGVALPAAFDTFFECATHKTPEGRYPSAVAAIRALAEALGVQPPAAEPSLSPDLDEAPVADAAETLISERAEATSGSIGARGELSSSGPVRAPRTRRMTVLALFAAAAAAAVIVGSGARLRGRPGGQTAARPVATSPAPATAAAAPVAAPSPGAPVVEPLPAAPPPAPAATAPARAKPPAPPSAQKRKPRTARERTAASPPEAAPPALLYSRD